MDSVKSNNLQLALDTIQSPSHSSDELKILVDIYFRQAISILIDNGDISFVASLIDLAFLFCDRGISLSKFILKIEILWEDRFLRTVSSR